MLRIRARGLRRAPRDPSKNCPPKTRDRGAPFVYPDSRHPVLQPHILSEPSLTAMPALAAPRTTLASILAFLAYTNLWIAGTAAGWAYAMLHVVHAEITAGALFVPFAIAFVVYTIDKSALLDPVADRQNAPDRTAFLLQWRGALLALAALVGLVGAGLAAARSLTCLGLYLTPLLVGAVYGAPILPGRRRPKDFVGFKNVIVAVSWAAGVGVLPLYYAGSFEAALVMTSGVWVALRALVCTTFFDERDVPSDRAAGRRTIPMLLGRTGTFGLLHGLSLGSSIALLFAGKILELGPVADFAAVWTAIFTGWFLIATERRSIDPDFARDVLVDGDGVIIALFVLAIS